jgi:hypothetical protein
MALSPEEHQVLDEIENVLADAEPSLSEALDSMRLPPNKRLRGRSLVSADSGLSDYGWVVLTLSGLLVGIAILWAGIVAGVPAIAIPAAALAQVLPLSIGLIARWIVRRRAARAHAAGNPDTGRNASADR